MSVNHPVKAPDSRETAKSFRRKVDGMRRGRSKVVGNRKRRTVVSILAVAVTLAGAGVLAAPSALAHGGGDEATAVDLVEQALAIVVNSPDAVDEALKRVETALAEVDHESTGELDVASLELAAVALKAGDLHDAEDALVAALGIDPHGNEDEPVEEAPSASATNVPPDGSADADVEPGSDQTSGAEDNNNVERPAETAAASTSEVSHGLTERVEGGFRAPTGTGVAALVVAGVFAVGGFALAHSKPGGK